MLLTLQTFKSKYLTSTQMYRHYTKEFHKFHLDTDIASQIDRWLIGFELQLPASQGNSAEIVGYVVMGNVVLITIRRWEVVS